jgi:hypothetical protein
MKIRNLTFTTALTFSAFCISQTTPGNPWQGSPQTLPGKIECEFYDEGGPGVAYSDSDPVNNGSGKLNPDDGTYYNTFRMHEAVDISYTKSDEIDNNPYNVVDPMMDQLYVGWTEPGEWIRYTVNIQKAGKYRLSLMYTANRDGVISLSLDGKDVSGELLVRSTYSFQETVSWRQWHHWNKAENLATFSLPAGIHVLTLHTVEKGNMNYDFLDFTLLEEE